MSETIQAPSRVFAPVVEGARYRIIDGGNVTKHHFEAGAEVELVGMLGFCDEDSRHFEVDGPGRFPVGMFAGPLPGGVVQSLIEAGAPAGANFRFAQAVALGDVELIGAPASAS